MSKARKPGKLLPFDAARYLTDDAAVAEYMTAVLETDDPDPCCWPLETSLAPEGRHRSPKTQGWGAKACTRLSLLAQNLALIPCLRWRALWVFVSRRVPRIDSGEIKGSASNGLWPGVLLNRAKPWISD